MQCGILGLIWEQKRHMKRKTVEMWIRSVVQLKVLWDINIKGRGIYMNSLYYFCKFSVILKLVQNKKLKK